MRLLLLADQESQALWDYYRPGRLDGIDLILSAGDLDADYLSFLVTMGHAPLIYVHGNHDTGYVQHPPEGCECAEDKVLKFRGLRILGLGGSPLYSGGPNQYTERQMARRIRRCWLSLRLAGGVDLVLTHAPPRGHGDAEDLPHRGFACFLGLMDRWRPRWLVHGHVHANYGPSFTRLRHYGDTAIINAWESYVLEI